jgi:hypothetical protein
VRRRDVRLQRVDDRCALEPATSADRSCGRIARRIWSSARLSETPAPKRMSWADSEATAAPDGRGSIRHVHDGKGVGVSSPGRVVAVASLVCDKTVRAACPP